jgi:hypothetical protein
LAALIWHGTLAAWRFCVEPQGTFLFPLVACVHIFPSQTHLGKVEASMMTEYGFAYIVILDMTNHEQKMKPKRASNAVSMQFASTHFQSRSQSLFVF